LKRYIVSGTEDPLWRQELHPVELPSLEPAPSDIEGAVRKALERRTDLINARKNLQSSDINLRYFRNQTLPDVDLLASYGAQGIGGTQFIRSGSGLSSVVTGSIPGGYADAFKLLTNRDFPSWNLQVNLTYNVGESAADAQLARSRVQKNQAQARLRALELQVATEVTNAALSVQSNLKRVEAAVAARELAEKRLEAEQSKFEVGMTTNFFVVQAQRDLRDAQNAELRALADYRKSLVTFERVQEAPGGSGGGGGTATTAGGGGTTGGTGNAGGGS
jgi:outer membrane protein TolC